MGLFFWGALNFVAGGVAALFAVYALNKPAAQNWVDTTKKKWLGTWEG